MKIWQQIFQLFFRQIDPENIDYDRSAAVAVIVISVGFNYLSFIAIGSLSNPLLYALVAGLSQALAVFLLLKLRNKENRFVQTITAVLGVTIIATMLQSLLAATQVLAIFGLFVGIYGLFLQFLVLRSALEANAPVALLALIFTNVAGPMILTLVFPEFANDVKAWMEAFNQTQQAAQG